MLTFSCERRVSVTQFRDVLVRSSLGERRPMDDPVALEGMLANANLVVTCWEGDWLVGIARSVTDFHFCCYLSDLAVDGAFQRRGIGKRLIQLTQSRLGSGCAIVVLAAPAAEDYYRHLRFDHHPQAWVLPRHRSIAVGC